MERRTFLRLGSAAALGASLSACGGGGGSDDAGSTFAPATSGTVVSWNNATLQAIRDTNASPPAAARSLAVVHSAMYDAWAAHDAHATGVHSGTSLRRPAEEGTAANRRQAFSVAAYIALLDQFPTQKPAFDAQLAKLGYSPADAAGSVGASAAQAALDFFHDDGANQLGTLTPGGIPYADYSGFAPTNPPMLVGEPAAPSQIPDPDHWQPLSYRDASGTIKTAPYLLPFWGLVVPFALTSGSQFRAPAPAPFASAEFTAQMEHVLEVQQGLTEAQKVMADFWAGGVSGELPPCYWAQFAQVVSQRDHHDDDADIKLFFVLSHALHDAGIAAWDTKRAYVSSRPITGIRRLMAGKRIVGIGLDGPAAGLASIAGETWMPYQLPSFVSPPFPDQVSGHSTFSMAAATVLKQFTGSDVFNHSVTMKARTLRYDPALPAQDNTLAWTSFSGAANEAGCARVYAGIHCAKADLDGRAMGAKVGEAVFEKAQRYWLGLG